MYNAIYPVFLLPSRSDPTAIEVIGIVAPSGQIARNQPHNPSEKAAEVEGAGKLKRESAFRFMAIPHEPGIAFFSSFGHYEPFISTEFSPRPILLGKQGYFPT